MRYVSAFSGIEAASVAWGASGLDAQFFGVAQRRRRVFLVGRLGDVRGPAEVLFEPQGVPWGHKPGREKRAELAAAAGRGAQGAGGVAIDGDIARGAHGCLNPQDPQSKRVFTPDSVGPTLNSGTLATANDQHLFQPGVYAMADLNANAAVDEELCGTLKVGGDPASVAGREPGGYAVRRLTPRECERLQGLPDDYSKVPFRGKPASECPDGPRYKAIGNSFAVPVVRWIGERIQMVEDKERGRR